MAIAVYVGDGDLGGLDIALSYEDWISVGLIYPPGGWHSDVEVFTVASNEVKTAQIVLGASVTSIAQPLCVPHIAPYQAPGISCYTVTGSDGLPIPPLEWRQRGGRLHVAINEDTTTATLTLTGAGIPELSPFSISVSDGQTDYSTLRLVGTGIAFRKHVVTLDTGLTDDLATQDIGATIDNEFIQTRGQAIEAAVRAMSKALGGYQTIQIESTGINRLGDSGSYRFITIAQLEPLLPFTTLADLNAGLEGIVGGTDVGAVNTWGKAQTADRFENQAFGNVAGARVPFDDAWYRIRSATIGPGGISYTAELDMLCSDVNEAWTAVSVTTVAELNQARGAATIGQFNLLAVPEGVIA